MVGLEAPVRGRPASGSRELQLITGAVAVSSLGTWSYNVGMARHVSMARLNAIGA